MEFYLFSGINFAYLCYPIFIFCLNIFFLLVFPLVRSTWLGGSVLIFTCCNALCIVVMLQPFDYDPNEKNRHKFLVQSLVVPDGPVANQEQWVR